MDSSDRHSDLVLCRWIERHVVVADELDGECAIARLHVWPRVRRLGNRTVRTGRGSRVRRRKLVDVKVEVDVAFAFDGRLELLGDDAETSHLRDEVDGSGPERRSVARPGKAHGCGFGGMRGRSGRRL